MTDPRKKSPLRMKLEAMQPGDELDVPDRNVSQTSAMVAIVRKAKGGVFACKTLPTCIRVRRLA